MSKFKVGDEVFIVQDTKSSLGDWIIGLIGEIKSLETSDADGRMVILVKEINRIREWYIHPNDFRKLTKLERALK